MESQGGFTIEDYDLRKCFVFEKRVLALSGIYPSGKRNVFFVTLNLFLTLGLVVPMVAQVVVNITDLSKILETLFIFMTELTYVCKIVNMAYYRRKILEIEDQLASATFYGFPKEQLDILKEKIEPCIFVTKIFRFLVMFGLAMFAAVPLLDVAKKWQLPLPGWYPFDTKKYYYHTAAFQMIAIYASAVNNASIDTLIWKLITVGTAQFEILKENLRSIQYTSGQRNTASKLKNCIKHHNNILKLVSNIEETFAKGVFIQFFASGIVICSTCFQLLFVPIRSTNFFCFISYLNAAMCQLSMYCWYGHDIMITSSEIGKFFYMSNWYESAVDIRKTMTVFLEKSKRPVILTAGNLLTLSLVTLTAILRSSYSFFAVLRRLYKDV